MQGAGPRDFVVVANRLPIDLVEQPDNGPRGGSAVPVGSSRPSNRFSDPWTARGWDGPAPLMPPTIVRRERTDPSSGATG